MADKEESAVVDDGERRAYGIRLLNRYAGYSAVVGLIPVPVIDVAAVTGIQIKLVSELAETYGLAFSENAVKTYVVSLIGGVIPVSGVSTGLFSLVKAVPGVGTLLGLAVVPAVAAASTWAVGRCFIWHFERGGTIENFDTDAMKTKFREEFETARSKVGRGGSRGAAKESTSPA